MYCFFRDESDKLVVQVAEFRCSTISMSQGYSSYAKVWDTGLLLSGTVGV